MKKFLSIIFLITIYFHLTNANDKTIEVTIKNGKIIGKRLKNPNNELWYDQFLGIPYAKSPTKRFYRSEPLEKFEKQPLEAFEWPSLCLQSDLWNISHIYYNNKMNEDCLYLNIWSPKVDINNEMELKPVFVYIHGGGLVMGGSSTKHLEGSLLSTMADAVVVNFNYRLSIFGLLYSDRIDSIKGNQALWDQTLLLEWVQQNIRYFGGDPKQVTIAGCSAGSWSVSAHIISPISRNLFKNAIMMSGSLLNVMLTKKQSVQLWLNYLRNTNCVTESDNSIDEHVIDCLNQMDVNDIMNKIMIHEIFDKGLIVIDGEFIPEHPMKMLKDGNHKKDFNLVISTAKDEGSGFVESFLAMNNYLNESKKFDFFNPEPLNSLEDASDILIKVSKSFLSDKRELSMDQLSKIYFNGLNPKIDEKNLLRRTVGEAFGDMWLGCPTFDFGHFIHKSDNNVNVYQLLHLYPVSTSLYCPKWIDVTFHGDDELTMFGDPIRNSSNYNQRLFDISNELIIFIYSFIRYGRPDTVKQPEWQNYFTVQNDKDVVVVRPYYQLSNDYRSSKSYGINYKDVECQFWRQFYRDH